MARVFISYRTVDTADLAGRLYDRLSLEHGSRSVFRDKNSIQPGDRWKSKIVDEVRRSDALLVVVDSRWVERFKDRAAGARPLPEREEEADETDWVRTEIVAALRHKVEIIPILTGGVDMPEPSDLPSEIERVTEYQALTLDDDRFEEQYRKLLLKLKSIEPRGSTVARFFRRYSQRSTRAAAAVAAALGMVSSTIAIAEFLGEETEAMTGRFNIAVAQLEPSGDSDLERRLARDVGNAIVTAMGSSSLGPDDRSFIVWGPARVGSVDGAEEAAAVADQLNADLLIYGDVSVDTFNTPTATVQAYSGGHNERAPWPVDISGAISLSFSQQSAIDGSLEEDPSLVATAVTMDGLASLLADNLDLADERFRTVEALLSDGGDPSTVAVQDRQILSMASAMRAWALLVEAGFQADPELVVEAEAPAALAGQLDPESDLAEIVAIQVDYMMAIPPRTGIAVQCDVGELPEPPEEAAIRRLIERTSTLRDSADDVGEIQALGLLGRLSVALLLAGDDQVDRIAEATGYFQDVLDLTEGDPALRFWRSDAHRWLGTLTTFSSAVSVEKPVGHFVAAARIDSPVWKARDLGSAGLAHRCRDDGSLVDAVCFFRAAARSPIETDATIYRSVAEEIESESGSDCPPDWDPDA